MSENDKALTFSQKGSYRAYYDERQEQLQKKIADILLQHGVPPELHDAMKQIALFYTPKSFIAWFAEIDLESLSTDLRATRDEHHATSLLPCAGGCGTNLLPTECHKLDAPGINYDAFCEACHARELAREQHRQARRSIRSALNRARAARLPATLTEGQWKETLAFFNDACAYCGKTWYVVEHIIPIEQGGGTTGKNCVPACFACNTTKGSNTLATWQPISSAHQVALRKWQDRE